MTNICGEFHSNLSIKAPLTLDRTNGTNGTIIGLHGNLRTQELFRISSTICHCGRTHAVVLRLIVRLIADWWCDQDLPTIV